MSSYFNMTAHANTNFWNGDGSWTSGPTLPARLMGHCLVQFDDTTTYLMGGCTNSSTAVSNFVYVFDWKTLTWTRSTDMNVPRCGKIFNFFAQPKTSSKVASNALK